MKHLAMFLVINGQNSQASVSYFWGAFLISQRYTVHQSNTLNNQRKKEESYINLMYRNTP